MKPGDYVISVRPEIDSRCGMVLRAQGSAAVIRTPAGADVALLRTSLQVVPDEKLELDAYNWVRALRGAMRAKYPWQPCWVTGQPCPVKEGSGDDPLPALPADEPEGELGE